MIINIPPHGKCTECAHWKSGKERNRPFDGCELYGIEDPEHSGEMCDEFEASQKESDAMDGISLDDFWALVNKNGCFRGDMIVNLAYKYDFEDKYTVSNQLLMCEPDGTYCWEYDWNEGQTDVKVLGFIFIDDVEVPGF